MKTKENLKKHRINNEIKIYGNVLVILPNGDKEKTNVSGALKLAESYNMDLVEINSSTKNPVLKIMNYDKYLYEQKKIEKKNRQNKCDIKEIQLSPNIAENDFNVKLKQAIKFLKDGDKVKITLNLKGRENNSKLRDLNKQTIFKFIVCLEENGVAEGIPQDNGNKIIATVKPKK